ncbi:MAG TPA: RdgB/HAM1 family non-canonical purine NTP pyrophosphatase [bacterium]|nr:RdgB/HAM1 family non-canonical purine NTP pyrophosphatase [bacterium]
MSGAHRRPCLVLATRNPGKVREIAAVFAHLPIVLRSLADYPQIGEIPEEGKTYADNAGAKALTVAAVTGEVALADDSGVEIEALEGAPGIHSARFLGEQATDADRNARVLALLRETPDAHRTARYRAAVAVALPAGTVRIFEGTCVGRIARDPRGNGGFGYDPIFVPEEDPRTMAEVPPDVKNRLSHRGRALRLAEPYLIEILRLAGKDRQARGAK